MLGTPGCPAARVELDMPLIRGFLSYKHRRDSRMWPQAMYSDEVRTFPFYLIFNYVASLCSNGLPCVRRIRLHFFLSSDEVGHSLCNFLSYLFFCLHFQMEILVSDREDFKALVALSFLSSLGQPSFTHLQRTWCLP